MILVAGATGALGSNITRRLAAQGRAVRALVRRSANYTSLVDAGVDPALGDLKDRQSLDRAMQGVETVITTANSALRGGDDNVETVEIQGNRNLIEAARAAGVKQFIFTSALGADVNSPVPLLRGKALSEEHLKASGLPYTILSPNIFMEVWFPVIIAGPVQTGAPITIIGEGNRKHSFVSSNDVAAFAVAAAGHRAALNQQIVIGGPEPLSWNDVVERAGRVLGRTLEVQHVAPGQPIPGAPDVVSGLMAGMDTYDSPVDMTAMAHTYGVELTPAEQVLRQMLGAA